MMQYATMFYQRFAGALLDPGQPTPPGLTTCNDSNPAVRFAVYRNNSVVSLVSALAEGFPVTRELVGGPFFDGMARCFVIAQPPASPVLSAYGDGFADFIAGFPPAAGLAYLPHVARLERARVKAFHAIDTAALTKDDLRRELTSPQGLPGSRVSLHPSCTVLVCEYAIASLWAAHQGLGGIAAVDPNRAEGALVLRDGDEVLVLPLSTASADFYRALAVGTPLGIATEVTTAADASFDLANALALLIHHGGIAVWHRPGDLGE